MNHSLVFAALQLASLHPAKVRFFIGTYTVTGGSRGIYESTLDPESGALAPPALAASMENPSYLALHPNGRYLYAVDESARGSVSAFSVGSGSQLLPLDSQVLNGSSPCYVSVSPDGKNAFTACYEGGVVSCLPIRSDGALAPVSSEIDNAGSGPDKKRQKGSHMHWVRADRTGRFVYSCDLGTDKVQCYHLVGNFGKLERTSLPDAMAPSGAGPRHGAWNPNGRFLYVNDEMGSSVCAFSVDRSTGSLSLIQTIGTVSGDDAASNTTAETACHPSGKWLYVSNRGNDSVTVFLILPDGRLKLIQIKPLGLHVPRGFAIAPNGQWLVAAGQESNDLEALPIDVRTGMLGEPGNRIHLDKPVCVVFAAP